MPKNTFEAFLRIYLLNPCTVKMSQKRKRNSVRKTKTGKVKGEKKGGGGERSTGRCIVVSMYFNLELNN